MRQQRVPDALLAVEAGDGGRPDHGFSSITSCRGVAACARSDDRRRRHGRISERDRDVIPPCGQGQGVGHECAEERAAHGQA